MPNPTEPPKSDQPQKSGKHEMKNRRENTALKQLTEAGDKETNKRCNNVTSRTLSHSCVELLGDPNESIGLNQHKGSLPVSGHPDQYRSVWIKLADNALKIIYVRNRLSIDLFDYIPGSQLLGCTGVRINPRYNHSVHVRRNVRFHPKPLREIRDLNAGKNRILRTLPRVGRVVLISVQLRSKIRWLLCHLGNNRFVLAVPDQINR
jgi:hypothetical protein